MTEFWLHCENCDREPKTKTDKIFLDKLLVRIGMSRVRHFQKLNLQGEAIYSGLEPIEYFNYINTLTKQK